MNNQHSGQEGIVFVVCLVRRNFRGKFNAGKLSIPNRQSFGFCFGEYHLKKQRNAVYTECCPTEEFRNSFFIFPN